jgi:hypothetical protein
VFGPVAPDLSPFPCATPLAQFLNASPAAADTLR